MIRAIKAVFLPDFYSFTPLFDFVPVQRRRWREGILRYDAQRAAQSDAIRRSLHARHRSHRQSVQALASHAGEL